MRKILVLLLVAGLLLGACSIQASTESAHEENFDLLMEGPTGGPFGNPVPCGGEGDGGGGLPG